MGCCGQKRAKLNNSSGPMTLQNKTHPEIETINENDQIDHYPSIVSSYRSIQAPVSLHYLQGALILVRGPATGRLYEFSGSNPDQPVDGRDAERLVHSRLFRRNH